MGGLESVRRIFGRILIEVFFWEDLPSSLGRAIKDDFSPFFYDSFFAECDDLLNIVSSLSA